MNYTVKNANRKLSKSVQGSKQARRLRQVGFIGKDGQCVNGCFGNVSPGMYNELVHGTTGVKRDLGVEDVLDEDVR